MQIGYLHILDALVPVERDLWVSFWNWWPEREVYANPGYVELFARSCDRVLCAAMRTQYGGIIYPFLIRPVHSEPWALAEKGWDLISPYGYGGAFAWNVSPEDSESFWIQFEEWAKASGLVSSFVRLSLFENKILPFSGEVEERLPNVVRKLNLSTNELWMDYAHKVRKNVKRAVKSGLELEIDPDGLRIEEFLELYRHTMDRRDASEHYYFGRCFFENMIKQLPGYCIFFHALYQGKIISTEFVLVSRDYIYSFLGGTYKEAFIYRPNDFLKHQIILWGIRNGKKAFILGGGYVGADGIFKYKLSFAPDGQVPFKIGKKIHDKEAFDRLVGLRRDWETARGNEWHPRAGFFPDYRS